MKALAPVLAFLLLTACSSPSNDADATTARSDAPASAPVPTNATPMQSTAVANTASATGTVEAVDVEAKTITIAHGPIEALKWPAMTMTFKAPDAELASFNKGDRVTFEFTEAQMKATITRISRQ